MQRLHAALAAANHSASASISTAAALAQGLIHTMFLAKVRSFGIGLLIVALLGTSVGITVYRVHADDAPAATPGRRAGVEDEIARLKRENEILKLQLQQTRQLLDQATHQIVDLRQAARAAHREEESSGFRKR